ncbi:MAG: uroporphyrinogen-III synthase [Puniceicoccales bacterium]|nr:uroporphyrinogen-III synthase [Puniceicoccales bacterium]
MARSKATAPLADKRIVVTRPEGQTESLRLELEKLGATVLEIPLIEIEYTADDAALKNTFDDIGQFDWIVFTSRNGVQGFFTQFFNIFNDIRGIGLARIACVGAGTAKAVREYHLNVDLMPEEATGEALGKEMVTGQSLEHLRVLVVTGNRNRETLVNILSEKGKAIVDTLSVYATYENDVEKMDAVESFRRDGADAIIFASPSAVEAFVAQARLLTPAKSARQPKAIAIGAVTAGAMREFGIPVAAQAVSPTPDALAAAVAQALK